MVVSQQVLKLYAWEGAFQERLRTVRDEELGYIRNIAFYLAGTSISFTCAPVLVSISRNWVNCSLCVVQIGISCTLLLFLPLLSQYTVISFTLYTLTSGNGALSAQIAFVSLTLVNNLTVPLTFLPNGIANLVQAVVSVKRLDAFFNDDELDPQAVGHLPSGTSNILNQENCNTVT